MENTSFNEGNTCDDMCVENFKFFHGTIALVAEPKSNKLRIVSTIYLNIMWVWKGGEKQLRENQGNLLIT